MDLEVVVGEGISIVVVKRKTVARSFCNAMRYLIPSSSTWIDRVIIANASDGTI